MIVNFEGFEDVNAFVDGQAKDIFGYATCAVITSSDGVVSPRSSGGGCFKGTSSSLNSNNNSGNANYWPRFCLNSRNSSTNSEGTFGFAYYNRLVTNQAWSTGNFFMTPLVAVCGTDDRPHFFIGINSSLQLLVYRWLANPNNYVWNRRCFYPDRFDSM